MSVFSFVLVLSLAGSASSQLPVPWNNRDIGNPHVAGSADYDPLTRIFTVRGDGDDIWEYADNFHYVYLPISGDCEITARVVSIEDYTDGWAQAGVMIRETLDGGSRHAMMAVSAGNNAAFKWRPNTNQLSEVSISYDFVTLPHWIRVERCGNSFSAYHSPDASPGSWMQQGPTVVIPMAQAAYVGLAVTSHDSHQLCTSRFNILDRVVTFGYASDPIPADGEMIDGYVYPEPPYDIWVMLDFTAGDGAVKHTAYFSDNRDDVVNRVEDANLGQPTDPGAFPTRYYIGIPFPEYTPYTQSLVRGTTYYWCVDETDDQGQVWQGTVWSFSIRLDRAYDPIPRDGQRFVSTTPTLTWSPGAVEGYTPSHEHDIYFGYSFDDVNNAGLESPEYGGSQWFGDETWEPNADGGLPPLQWGTDYYWRVDEVHDRTIPIRPGMVAKGDVWRFTTMTPLFFVDIDATGANDGSSWADAYKYLQDALTDANSAVKPVEIRVAQGIYKPDQSSADPNGTGDRTATFQLINGVAIKGGYAGFGEPDPNARNIDFYETILSGDLADNDADVNEARELLDDPCRAENSYHVVCSYIADANAVLDGFTITSGNANGTYGANDGGGVYNLYGAPTIFNCTFIHNTAFFGGGMFNYAFDPYGSGGQPPPEYAGNPFLNNCTFIMNSAEYSGGGMFNCCLAEPTVTNCVFLDNWADMFGGGMYNSDSNSIITNCTFSENSTNEYGGGMSNRLRNPIVTGCTFRKNSAQYGGGMDNWENSSPIVTNCIFVENEAFEGGGMFSRESSPRLINCTFSWNWCYGILNFGGGTVTLTNCILWGDWFGEEIAGGPVVATYSNVQGGWPGEGNIDTNPCFAEPGHWEDPCNTPDDFWDDVWVEGDYHLKSAAGRWDPNSESWVIDGNTSPCIDAGNPGCPSGSEPSPNGNRKNMGAYGGTAEASKTPANWRSIADLTNDWTVDFNDLKVFVDYWLETGECIPGDLNRSQFVDFVDFAILGQQWSEAFAIEPGIGKD